MGRRPVNLSDVAAIVAASVMVPLFGNLILAAFVGRLRGLATRPETLERINLACGWLLILVALLILFA